MKDLLSQATIYLNHLCVEIGERCVGSDGNKEATTYFEDTLTAFGWHTETPKFQAMDWHEEGAILEVNENDFEVLVSPYSPGCEIRGKLISASTIGELEDIDAGGKILILHGDIAAEQLMPKNFVFYNPEKHQKIISLLEKSGVPAIICVTSRNASLAGGVYLFPLIEDGDFDIPSVYMTEMEGNRLLQHAGKAAYLRSTSRRIPSYGVNVIGTMGEKPEKRIVISAHIDAKMGTPGAIDNGTGVVILMLLADHLSDYNGRYQIEIVAFNGEDYYAAPGQMNYIKSNEDSFENILLNVNIDGAGFHKDGTYFSLFNLPQEIREKVENVILKSDQFTEGPLYPQGDHSIFTQNGCPAIAISSKWLIDNLDDQDITHTPKDNVGIVDPKRLVEIAEVVNSFIRKL